MQDWHSVAFDLLRMNSDWLWVTDARGNLTEWRNANFPDNNQAPAGGFGLWSSILRDDRVLRDDRAQLLTALKNGRSFRCLRTACLMPHLGVRGWLRVSGSPIVEDGKIIGYRGAALNVTSAMMVNRKMERMDKHTKNLMTVLDASPLAIFIAHLKDMEWRITYANVALATLSGFCPSTILGKSALFMLENNEDPIVVEMIKEKLAKQMQVTQRLHLGRKDGSTFWAEITLIPGCKEGGVCTLFGLMRDVEAEMAYQKAELQQSRLQALGQLAGGMAHEINNLLQPACLNTEILADEFAPDSPSLDLIKDITDGLNQIRYIVRNTLQFSRKESEQKEEQAVAFVPLLEERLTYLRTLLPTTVELTLTIPQKSEGNARLNPIEFTQVITNLLNNASHAMHGKGKVTIDLKKVYLDGVRSQRETLPLGNYFVLTITDTGSGMSDAVAARIFEPFFTTKAVGEGTGLGLSVVYGIVTRWGGTISVKSKPDEGTSFTLYVPEDVEAALGTDHLNFNQGVQNGYAS